MIRQTIAAALVALTFTGTSVRAQTAPATPRPVQAASAPKQIPATTQAAILKTDQRIDRPMSAEESASNQKLFEEALKRDGMGQTLPNFDPKGAAKDDKWTITNFERHSAKDIYGADSTFTLSTQTPAAKPTNIGNENQIVNSPMDANQRAANEQLLTEALKRDGLGQTVPTFDPQGTATNDKWTITDFERHSAKDIYGADSSFSLGNPNQTKSQNTDKLLKDGMGQTIPATDRENSIKSTPVDRKSAKEILGADPNFRFDSQTSLENKLISDDQEQRQGNQSRDVDFDLLMKQLNQSRQEVPPQFAGWDGYSVDLTGGQSFTTVALEPIYRNYDPNKNGVIWQSLDLFPPSPSEVMTSLDLYPMGPSSVGWSLDLNPAAPMLVMIHANDGANDEASLCGR